MDGGGRQAGSGLRTPVGRPALDRETNATEVKLYRFTTIGRSDQAADFRASRNYPWDDARHRSSPDVPSRAGGSRGFNQRVGAVGTAVLPASQPQSSSSCRKESTSFGVRTSDFLLQNARSLARDDQLEIFLSGMTLTSRSVVAGFLPPVYLASRQLLYCAPSDL